LNQRLLRAPQAHRERDSASEDEACLELLVSSVARSLAQAALRKRKGSSHELVGFGLAAPSR